MFAGFEGKRVPVGGGVTIDCALGGAGPPVLLLHGFPQSKAMWTRVAPMLAEHFTVVVADLRGYGDSSKPAAEPGSVNYAFRAMAADQVAVMRALGHDRFHVVGHDRGARTAHRLALDHADCIMSLAVLDIVPTLAVFESLNRDRAMGFWHWFFLSQPAPFPERTIEADPDGFFQTCMAGWGRSKIEDFEPDQMAEYRRCWRDPAMIHGACSDYRAATGIDLEHDRADRHVSVIAPVLALWGATGAVANSFDPRAEWEQRCARLECATMPYGHFFIDRFPEMTASVLRGFLSQASGAK